MEWTSLYADRIGITGGAEGQVALTFYGYRFALRSDEPEAVPLVSVTISYDKAGWMCRQLLQALRELADHDERTEAAETGQKAN